ncbi:hypothetical protein C8F04DRAFT_1267515 [Mycena alexandri]|uniref:Uncharacterized protein n=1 Tax=Mycena alexandri TaxID=1745969 RepID=A0AAD6WTU5_9AGAR|nr:hypothetical protein C8F04DRAFT_1267515 [Mycena alexandri]
MPRAGTAARKRAREGLPAVKPGKASWVFGTKAVFFSRHKDEFLAAVETKTQGTFYSKVAQLYLKKYGYHTEWDADLEDEDSVADDVDPDEEVNSLAPEEAEFRADYFTKLRTKLGVWYNTQYKTDLPTKKTQKMSFTKLFDKPELEPPTPVKMRTLHYYSRHFYTERIKARVAARWQALSRLPNPPKMITVRTKVTKEAWLAETQEFRDEVTLALEKEYATAQKAYQIAVAEEAPTTAEEFSVALNNAAYYLQPFADAIHERFGMNVALMLCGPIPDRGGRIEVRSVHSGTSNGLVPRIWSDFDRGNFDVAQRSFVDFTHHCFTDDECEARALKTMVPAAEEEVDDAAGRSMREDDPMSRQSAPDATGPTGDDPIDNAPTPLFTMPTSTAVTQDTGPLNSDDPIDNAPTPLFTMPTSTAATKDTGPLPARPTPIDTTPMPSFSAMESSTDARMPTLTDEEYAAIIAAAGGEDAWVKAGDFDLSNGDLDLDLDLDLLQSSAYTETGWLKGGDEDMGSGEPDDARLGQVLQLPPLHTADAFAGGGRGIDRHANGVSVSGRQAVVGAPAGDENSAGQGKRNVERPKPKPAYRGALSKLVEQAVLERPEVNPDAQGPLDAEGQKPVTREMTVAADDDKAGEEEVQGDDDGGEVNGVWEEEDMSEWPDELKYAYAGFERGQDWGGDVWKACVDALIAVERAQGFRAKGWLSWDKPFALTSEIGPTANEGSMADRWWNWWGRVQPASRMQPSGKFSLPERVPLVEWENLGKMSGRNGVLLYVGALLWWGEAAAETENEKEREVLMKDWRWAVDDVASVLRLAAASTISAAKKSTEPTAADCNKPKKAKGKKPTAGKPKSTRPKAAPADAKAGTPKVATQTATERKRGSKRRQADVPGEKENEPARKRARRR